MFATVKLFRLFQDHFSVDPWRASGFSFDFFYCKITKITFLYFCFCFCTLKKNISVCDLKKPVFWLFIHQLCYSFFTKNCALDKKSLNKSTSFYFREIPESKRIQKFYSNLIFQPSQKIFFSFPCDLFLEICLIIKTLAFWRWSFYFFWVFFSWTEFF